MEDNLYTITAKDRTLQAVQALELEILKEFDRICRKHGIEYSLGGGTCLGQVRHGGFIPWDDDIDVDITLENYEKFLAVYREELDDKKYYFHSRETDPSYLRSCSRIELRDTAISLPGWDKRNITHGIFIDIFTWSYLPDNKFLRKIVSTLLFYIRCMESYKMLNKVPGKVPKTFKQLFVICCSIFPYSLLLKAENKLRHVCKGKTGWIFDDAIINGNHHGYPSDGIDEYEDVQFEGVTVRNKKNSDNFLRTIYGEHYNEWLPPVKRISHHFWTKLDLGEYEKNFRLPENYSDYFTIKYTEEKLKQMQKVSYDILHVVDRICRENNLQYFLLGKDPVLAFKGWPELSSVWTGPMRLAMPRKDFTVFTETMQSFLPSYMTLQIHTNEPLYYHTDARIRLSSTLIKERRIPPKVFENINTGFFVDLVPMDFAPNNAARRSRQCYIANRMNNILRRKCSYSSLLSFSKVSWKKKMMLLVPLTKKALFSMLDKCLRKYNQEETDFYIIHIGNAYFSVKKEVFESGKQMVLNCMPVTVPEDLAQYSTVFENHLEEINPIRSMGLLKDGKPMQTEKNSRIQAFISETAEQVQIRYPACFLNYFDFPENQLSVLRYDEKNETLIPLDTIIQNL